MRVDDQSGENAFVYTVEYASGEHGTCSLKQVRSYPLLAKKDEHAWNCRSCSAKGWSLAHAGICIKCGAPSPEDEELMQQKKMARRMQMADERPRYLKNRRMTKAPPQLSSTPLDPLSLIHI